MFGAAPPLLVLALVACCAVGAQAQAQDAAHAAHVAHKHAMASGGASSDVMGDALGALAGGGSKVGPGTNTYIMLVIGAIAIMDILTIYHIWTAHWLVGKVANKLAWTLFVICVPIVSVIAHCMQADANPKYVEFGMSAEEKAECDAIVRKHQEKLRAEAANRAKPVPLDQLI